MLFIKTKISLGKIYHILIESLLKASALLISFLQKVASNIIFIVVLAAAFVTLVYQKFHSGSNFLVGMPLLILLLTVIRHRNKSKEGIANALFDSVIWLCLSLVGFYGGFYLFFRKINHDKRKHAISVINSTFNRVTNRIYYLEDIHHDVPVDAEGIHQFMNSRAQVPYYLLDQLPVDNVLIYLSPRTFEFLYKAETFERKLQKYILDTRRSAMFRTECLQATIILLKLIDNQLLAEEEFDANMDSLTLRDRTNRGTNMLNITKRDVQDSSILHINFMQR